MAASLELLPRRAPERESELFIATDIGESLAASLYIMLEQDGMLPVAFYQKVPPLSEFLGWLKDPGTVHIGCFVRRVQPLDFSGKGGDSAKLPEHSGGGSRRNSPVELAGMGWIWHQQNNCGARIAECGMVLLRKYRRNRMPREFARQMISFVFSQGIDVIFGSSIPGNRPALTFARRLGFKQTCSLPKFSSVHGVPSDIVVSFLEKGDWNDV